MGSHRRRFSVWRGSKSGAGARSRRRDRSPFPWWLAQSFEWRSSILIAGPARSRNSTRDGSRRLRNLSDLVCATVADRHAKRHGDRSRMVVSNPQRHSPLLERIGSRSRTPWSSRRARYTPTPSCQHQLTTRSRPSRRRPVATRRPGTAACGPGAQPGGVDERAPGRTPRYSRARRRPPAESARSAKPAPPS